MKLCFVLGTRPEIIKMSPLILECDSSGIDYFIIHTNQHYSENMDKIFFEELNLKPAHYNLNVGSGSHGDQTARMMIGIERVLLAEKPDFVFVQGDTNSVLAGGLVASKLGMKVVHVEAGLRSYDRAMPEEINRIVVDHISDVLLCPTQIESDICVKEGIDKSKIFVIGNTIVDAVLRNIDLIEQDEILRKHGLERGRYIMLTMHRPSNVDDSATLKKQITNIELLAKHSNLKVLFPAHPRTINNIKKFDIKPSNAFILKDPLGYFDMLALIKNAKVVVTDSGGIQEEACILKTPSIVLRENTERPQVVDVGASITVGCDEKKLLDAYNIFLNKNRNWSNPFGDGKASKKIIDIICIYV